MFYGASHLIFQKAEELRNRSTPAEDLLWQHLNSSKLGAKFLRQHPCAIYVLDFYCHEIKLCIEIDGSIYQSEEVKHNDYRREQSLSELGISIIRFSNNEVFQNTSKVLNEIQLKINQLQIVNDCAGSPSGAGKPGLCKRIIPCLDIKDGRTVKGINFENIRDAGDPVELGAFYAQQGADELVFLDITATVEKRKTLSELVLKIAQRINIPFTVGGGISSIDDVHILLANGADKISVNTSAFKNPSLLNELSKNFGSQCVVLAIDTKQEEDGEWYVYLNGGRTKTGIKCFDWAKEAVDRGAGEILLTSMNNDGTKKGFAIDITKQLSINLPVPVIASGGGGTMEHFKTVFEDGCADAALAASIFHFKEIAIPDLKRYLQAQNIIVRNS